MANKIDNQNKLTLGQLISWLLGALSLFLGIIMLSDPSVHSPAIILLLWACLLLPPIRNFVYLRTGKSISTGTRALLMLIILAIGISSGLPGTSTHLLNTTQNIEKTTAASELLQPTTKSDIPKSDTISHNNTAGSFFVPFKDPSAASLTAAANQAAPETTAPAKNAATGSQLTGTVIAVSDGDTITLRDDTGIETRIRLAEIDAPETSQPYGDYAKQILSSLCLNAAVIATPTNTDRYGRTVARLYSGDLDINAELIRRGAAWAYRQYLTDQSLLALEAEARDAERGLWGATDAAPVPPWEWRHPSTQVAPAPIAASPETPRAPAFRAAPASPPANSATAQCSAKRTCGAMSDCAEARFYLTTCGLKSLDRDGDGTPCETLCR